MRPGKMNQLICQLRGLKAEFRVRGIQQRLQLFDSLVVQWLAALARCSLILQGAVELRLQVFFAHNCRYDSVEPLRWREPCAYQEPACVLVDTRVDTYVILVVFICNVGKEQVSHPDFPFPHEGDCPRIRDELE